MANNKVPNIPNLRFPEFKEEWKKYSIGELALKVGSGVTPKGGNAVYKTEGHPFVRSQNVGWGVLLLDDIVYIDKETHERQKNTELHINDVLLNITGASIGRSALVDKRIKGGNVNQHVCIIRPKDNLVSSFLCNFLLSHNGQKQIDSFQAGGNRQGLNFEQIRSIKINLPSVEEQLKVSTLLQLIEQRIVTQNKIIEKLQSLIRGIRKRVFEQLNSSKVQLQAIAEIYQPQTISSKEMKSEGYLVYGANGTIGHYNHFNHKNEQVCITCRGNTCGTVNYTKPNSWITGNSMVINVDKYIELVNRRYLYHYLLTVNFQSLITGSGQPQIVREPLAHLKILLPSIAIQQEIATALDTLEKKVNIESKQLDLFIMQRNYLLQQMFI